MYSYVRLDEYRDAPIPQSLLEDLATGLDAARAAGVKVILRFAYNFGPYPDTEPDASKARILDHIAQVEPYLAAYEDVIAAMQAGFINPRPLQVVLGSGAGARRAMVAGVDPRQWPPGSPITLQIEVQLPSDLAPGDHALGLALPDAAASIADRPEYAIRLANENVWDAEAGANVLATLRIDDGAAGDAAPDVAALRATLVD